MQSKELVRVTQSIPYAKTFMKNSHYLSKYIPKYTAPMKMK